MANTQDAKNVGEIKKKTSEAIKEKIIPQITDDLEKEIKQAVLLRQKKNIDGLNLKQDVVQKRKDGSVPLQGYNPTPSNEPFNERRTIRETTPNNENRPDTIYDNRENWRSQDMSGDYEQALKENVDRDHESALQENVDRDYEEALKENKSREKGKDGKTTAETPEKKQPGPSEGITPGTKDQPFGAEGLKRADTEDTGAAKKPEEKKSTPEQGAQREKIRNRDLSREQRLVRIKQHKEKKAQKKKEEAKKTEEKAEANVGKMSPLAFIIWIFLAMMADIGSIIPYVGLLFSWPFALAFAIYKWHIKIKKELAIATTVLDFLFEGLLSTLPVSTLDVIMTGILSNSKITRKIAHKVSEHMPGRK